MAEQLKQIKDFTTLPDFGDGDLLLAQSAGTTYNVKGAALKKYAAASAEAQAREAAASAAAAAEKLTEMEGVAAKMPVIDPDSGCWQIYNSGTGAYESTDRPARGPRGEQGLTGPAGPVGPQGERGSNFVILGYYASLAALQDAITAPVEGDAYGVGTAAPYDIYVWDGPNVRWVNNGSIQGPAGADGKDGADGQSPYQIAAAGGYAGTEAEFNAVLAQVGDVAAVLDALNGEVI